MLFTWHTYKNKEVAGLGSEESEDNIVGIGILK